jgi:hypothetical protein
MARTIPDSWWTVFDKELNIIVEHEDREEAIRLAREARGNIPLIVEGYTKYTKCSASFINSNSFI